MRFLGALVAKPYFHRHGAGWGKCVASFTDRGLRDPGGSVQQDIEHDVDVEEDFHVPYLSMRCSSIQRFTVASSGAGWGMLSRAITSAAE